MPVVATTSLYSQPDRTQVYAQVPDYAVPRPSHVDPVRSFGFQPSDHQQESYDSFYQTVPVNRAYTGETQSQSRQLQSQHQFPIQHPSGNSNGYFPNGTDFGTFSDLSNVSQLAINPCTNQPVSDNGVQVSYNTSEVVISPGSHMICCIGSDEVMFVLYHNLCRIRNNFWNIDSKSL